MGSHWVGHRPLVCGLLLVGILGDVFLLAPKGLVTRHFHQLWGVARIVRYCMVEVGNDG